VHHAAWLGPISPFASANSTSSARVSSLSLLADAKAVVTRFLDEIGYDTVDAGPLGSGGRRFQFGSRAFVTPYGGLRERGTPADVAAIRATLGV
jgi:hypothetical protein